MVKQGVMSFHHVVDSVAGVEKPEGREKDPMLVINVVRDDCNRLLSSSLS